MFNKKVVFKFRMGKMKFHHPPEKIALTTPGKIRYWPRWKKTLRDPCC